MKSKLAALRKNAGYSQGELAKIAGIGRTTIWKIEAGKAKVVKTSTLCAIARALNMKIDDIFLL